MLRTCVRDNEGRLTAHGGFIWPAHGVVECPDWKPTKACGNGLHGFLRGCGSGRLANWTDKAVWLVVDIVARQVVDLGDKIKVPGGRVIFSGDRLEALALMARLGHLDAGHVGGTATAGDSGTATAGDRGTATAGDCGTATAGDCGTATAGDGGTATAGDGGTATAGYRGTATAGYGGTSTSGDGGTSTSGYGGTSTSGDGGTSTSGDGGTSTSGYRGTSTSGVGGTATAGVGGTATAGVGGTATAGVGGTATAGVGGTIQIKWWDAKTERYRITTGYVGEDGIEANTKYHLVDTKFVRVNA